MSRKLKWILLGLLLFLMLIQFIPVDRSNPPVEQDITAPENIKSVLRQSCYDCHSNETNWPWYSQIAPVSWLVAHDVSEGREHLNFSTWNVLDSREQTKAIDEIWEEVEKGEMPLWYYLPLHPEAKLTEQDLSVLREWNLSSESQFLNSE
jgi:hypothetical protein